MSRNITESSSSAAVGSKRGRAPKRQPPVLVVGSTGRLVSVAAVAVELGLSDHEARKLLDKLSVMIRPIGRTHYILLFQLERALWRWYGLSEDLHVFELAHMVYRDMEKRGVERHLKRLGLRELASRLKKRAMLSKNLDKMARTAHMRGRKNGRPASGASWLEDEIERLNAIPELGPSARADPALEKVRENPDCDLPPGECPV